MGAAGTLGSLVDRNATWCAELPWSRARNSMVTAIPCRTLHNTFLHYSRQGVKNEFDQKADDHPSEHPEPARQPAIRLKRRSNDVESPDSRTHRAGGPAGPGPGEA